MAHGLDIFQSHMFAHMFMVVIDRIINLVGRQFVKNDGTENQHDSGYATTKDTAKERLIGGIQKTKGEEQYNHARKDRLGF